MFFAEPNLDINILSVVELDWDSGDGTAAPRPFHSLSFRTAGGADFTHANTSLHVSPGDVLYIPADYAYTISSGAEHLFVVHFEVEGSVMPEMQLLTVGDAQYLRSKFETLYTAWTKKQIGYQYECKAIFYKMLLHLYRQAEKEKIVLTNDKMQDVVDYIHEHFTDVELNVTALARMAHMSDTYFRKLFVCAYGETPLKYINNLRVLHGVELLQTGYYSVAQAAAHCGFDNPKYFSTVVKRMTQISPSAYQKSL